ncbi:MAG: hypothetical protein ACPGOY_08340 [Rhodospirillaceae bacterium]
MTPHSTAREAIAREERVGLSFMLWGRLAVLGLLALWILLTVSEDRSSLYLALEPFPTK